MKKLIAILVVFAMITGVAFAQMAPGITINAWGQGAMVPLIIETAPQGIRDFDNQGKPVYGTIQEIWWEDKDGNEVDFDHPDAIKKTEDLGARSYAGTGAAWGWGEVSVGFNVSGWSEFVGFNFSLGTDGGGWMAGDIWAKPFNNDYLKITIGNIEDDTLRGKVGGGSKIGDFHMGGGAGENEIFARFPTDNGDGNEAYFGNHGFFLTSVPMDGLFIGIMVNTEVMGGPWHGLGVQKAKDVYRYAQIGVGYTIENIGLARLQWIGGWFGNFEMTDDDVIKKTGRFDFDTDNAAAIQAAFNLTAVENLSLDIGFKYFLPITISGKTDTNKKTYDLVKFSKGMNVALGAAYQMDAFAINLMVNAGFGSSVRLSDDVMKVMYAKEGADGWNSDGTVKASWVSEDKNTDPITIDIRLTPSYELDFATVGLDLALNMTTASKSYVEKFNKDEETIGWDLEAQKDNTMQLGFGAWLQKGLGSGSITAGFTYTLPRTVDGNAFGSGLVMIPIILEYAFF